MGDLRWVLLGLGALLILAVYAWGRGLFQRFNWPFKNTQFLRQIRQEPRIDLARAPLESSDEEEPSDGEPEGESKPEIELPEKVVTVRLIPREKEMPSEQVILALRAAGLSHGRYGIFHMYSDDRAEHAMFSVANLTEPGSFDLSKLSESTIPGMSFFLLLPGEGDPVTCFDTMVDTARTVANSLNAELLDERGSSWSIQRERYIREEVIEYRHHFDREPGR